MRVREVPDGYDEAQEVPLQKMEPEPLETKVESVNEEGFTVMVSLSLATTPCRVTVMLAV